MPSRQTWIVLALLAPAAGCATIQSGPVGVPLDASNHPQPRGPQPELQVSAGEKPDLASPYFGLVEITFENNSPSWKQIDRIAVDFGTPDKNSSVQIPWGTDIDAWEDAVLERNQVRAMNEQSVLGAVAAIGAMGRAAGHRHGPGAAVGGVLTVGAVGALYAQNATAALNGAPAFSGSHLLSMPIRIPPGLFAKRWILLYTAARPLGGCVDSMILSYTTSDHQQGRVLLSFKVWSEWQRGSCGGETMTSAPG